MLGTIMVNVVPNSWITINIIQIFYFHDEIESNTKLRAKHNCESNLLKHLIDHLTDDKRIVITF